MDIGPRLRLLQYICVLVLLHQVINTLVCNCLSVPAGGIATHDAVVWGSTKEEQERRKAADDPLLKVGGFKSRQASRKIPKF